MDWDFVRYEMKKNLLEGIFLIIKYGLIVLLIIYAFNFSQQTRQAAVNGEQAALVILEYQRKGWLPKLINGEAPKVEAPTR